MCKECGTYKASMLEGDGLQQRVNVCSRSCEIVLQLLVMQLVVIDVLIHALL